MRGNGLLIDISDPADPKRIDAVADPLYAYSIYDIVGGKLVFRSYYKIPPVQTEQENCVSHIPSLIPVPGHDIFVQAWYQGGASVVDFSDSSNPTEIGFYDRGPISFDVYGLTPTEQVSENEIEAAREVQVERLNVQHQDKITWEPSFDELRGAVLDLADSLPGPRR